MKALFNDMSAVFANHQLTVTLDVDSDDIGIIPNAVAKELW